MTDQESNEGDVELLAEIAGGIDRPLDSSRLTRVIGMIAMGLVKREPEPDGSSRLRLTEKGQDVLASHGMRANESSAWRQQFP